MTYFDAASGERLHPVARQTLDAALERGWADPARLYSDGRRSRALLDQARSMVAAAIGARSEHVSFTSSGTQANHLAVLGLLSRRPARAVVGAVEHSSVLRAAEWCEGNGGSTTIVPVDRTGLVRPEAVAEALADPAGGPLVGLVAVQSANHEVGTRQPVAGIAEVCRAAEVPLVVDAAQSIGRADGVPEGWSLLTGSAHKWGGPAGVGVLAVRPGTRWRSPLPGDEREGGRVPGFVDVPSIVAAAAALDAVRADAAAEDARLSELVARIRAAVPQVVPDVEVVGHDTERLPHVVTFSCLYVDGESLVTSLDRAGFAISSGSSCTASTLEPSHVLVAMGVLTHGNVRVSLPRGIDAAEVDRFLAVLPDVVAGLRAEAGVADL